MRGRRRAARAPARALAGAATIALIATAPAGAGATQPTALPDCLNGAAAECLSVPTGDDAVATGLYAERVGDDARKAQAVLLLAGGPGQAATPILPSLAKAIVPALDRFDIIGFDQRGTGRSGLAACPSLAAGITPPAVASCAAALGGPADRYATDRSVADVDAVLDAFGVRRVTLVAVSYGTHLALRYAAAHPDRVAGVVLDSAVGPEGLDPLQRSTLRAAGRVLRALCSARACGFTRDPAADVRRLVARWGGRAVRAPVIDAGGRSRFRAVDGATVLDLVAAGDTDPTARVALPAAVRSALDGDLAPLARMADDLESAAAAAGARAASADSLAVRVATVCADTPLPWPAAATPAQREAAALAAARDQPAAALAPFDAATAAASLPLRACAGWPATTPGTPAPSALPDVPALIVGGDQDVRTPLEDARALAARLPRARLLTVAGVGHSTVGSDLSGCALRAVRRFLAGTTPPSACHGRWVTRRATGVLPRTLADVPGRSPGARLATATALTIRDALSRTQRLPAEHAPATTATGLLTPVGPGRGGGLRGGWIRRDLPRVELHAVRLVGDLALSGTIHLDRPASHLTLRAPAGARARASATLLRDGRLIVHRAGHRLLARVPGGLRTVA